MSLSKKLFAFIEEAKNADGYWVEKAKLGFSMSLERWRRLSGLSNKELAEKINTSPAYITKVFRGDTNFTIETMVKLSRACGGEIDIQIVEVGTNSKTWAEHARRSHDTATGDWLKKLTHPTCNAATGVVFTDAANSHWFDQSARTA